MPEPEEIKFREWVHDTFNKLEGQQILDCFLQSGCYPQEFLDEREEE